VDNHSIGAVTDFVWLDTPILKDEKDLEKEEEKLREAEVGREEFGVDEKDGDGEGEGEGEGKLSKGQKKRKKQKSKKFGNSRNSNSERFTEHDYDHVHDHDHDHDHDHERGSTSIIALADEIDLNLIKFANIWQHVCSVGRDGKVLIQVSERSERALRKTRIRATTKLNIILNSLARFTRLPPDPLKMRLASLGAEFGERLPTHNDHPIVGRCAQTDWGWGQHAHGECSPERREQKIGRLRFNQTGHRERGDWDF